MVLDLKKCLLTMICTTFSIYHKPILIYESITHFIYWEKMKSELGTPCLET